MNIKKVAPLCVKPLAKRAISKSPSLQAGVEEFREILSMTKHPAVIKKIPFAKKLILEVNQKSAQLSLTKLKTQSTKESRNSLMYAYNQLNLKDSPTIYKMF